MITDEEVFRLLQSSIDRHFRITEEVLHQYVPEPRFPMPPRCLIHQHEPGVVQFSQVATRGHTYEKDLAEFGTETDPAIATVSDVRKGASAWTLDRRFGHAVLMVERTGQTRIDPHVRGGRSICKLIHQVRIEEGAPIGIAVPGEAREMGTTLQGIKEIF